MATVNVIGLGYMGLPMAAMLAEKGHNVLGVDINPEVVAAVNAGQTHLHEPGLPELVARAHKGGNLKAAEKPEKGEIFIISVPTPFMEENKTADMRFVRAAAANIAPVLEEGNLVIVESTSPVGGTRADVVEVINAARPELAGKVDYAFCPERAIPGRTLQEMVENDRIIGGLTPEATTRTRDFYQTFITGTLLETDCDTAEMVKLVENTSRDVQIAFANELSHVCDKLGLDVWEVIQLANHHPRVNILQPGPGVGGHCIAVDPWFIIEKARDVTPLMQAARHINDGKPGRVVEKILAARKKRGKAKVALLGLAYKPDVDDFRESPSVQIAEKVIAQIGHENVLVCEPYMKKSEKFQLVSLEKALEEAEVVVMLTHHSDFKAITLGALEGKDVIDTRGVLRGVLAVAGSGKKSVSSAA